MIVAHGIMCTVGFLGLLPLGALLARWLRTFSTRWFAGHWFVQTVLSGPVIIAGVALGILTVNGSGGMHLDDTHKVSVFDPQSVQITLLTMYLLFRN